MTGLTDKASGEHFCAHDEIEEARRRWEESMLQQIDALRQAVRLRPPQQVALLSGAELSSHGLILRYWSRTVSLPWPDLEPRWADSGHPCPAFDAAMLLYYLRCADGTPLADRWISFRELPDGTFYVLAYQRYSGDRLARSYGNDPAAFDTVCRLLGGWPLPAISPHAFAFEPLPRIRLAAVLWPGDDEFPPRGNVLFDAAASHYMTTDGLGLLGGGLAGRLVRQNAPTHTSGAS